VVSDRIENIVRLADRLDLAILTAQENPHGMQDIGLVIGNEDCGWFI
jgi:hypothetical protein